MFVSRDEKVKLKAAAVKSNQDISPVDSQQQQRKVLGDQEEGPSHSRRSITMSFTRQRQLV